MKTLYHYRIVTYILSVLGILVAFFLLIFGVITWATNTISNNIEANLEEYYGTDVVMQRFFSVPETSDEILYIRYSRNSEIDYASFNYETSEIFVDETLPANAIELPAFFYLTDGFTVFSIALLVGILSFVLLILTIIANVNGNKLKRLEVQSIEYTDKRALEEAKALAEKGLINLEEFKIISKKLAHRDRRG